MFRYRETRANCISRFPTSHHVRLRAFLICPVCAHKTLRGKLDIQAAGLVLTGMIRDALSSIRLS